MSATRAVIGQAEFLFAVAGRGREDDAPPSPEEIRKRCRQIQAEWSPRERLRRAGVFAERPWLAPLVSVAEMRD